MDANKTPAMPGFDPSLTLTCARNGREVFTIHGMPPMRATELAVAVTSFDAMRAALSELLTECDERADRERLACGFGGERFPRRDDTPGEEMARAALGKLTA